MVLYHVWFQLDADGDGQLSLEEFKVLFDNAEKRKKDQKISSRKASFKSIFPYLITDALEGEDKMLKLYLDQCKA